MLQQMETLRPSPEPSPEVTREPPAETKAPAASTAGELRIFVKGFRFEGNVQISTLELDNLVAEHINKSLTFDELTRVTEMITAYYQSKGWLARAILPEQDVTSGVVTIRILEGRLSRVVIDNQSQRVSNERVENWVYSNLPQGTELSLEKLDRAVLTLNDQPDLNVVASLQEGQASGDTEVLITVTDRAIIDGQVIVDNFGDTNTGIVRGAVSGNINGVLGFGDQVNVYALYTQGSAYGRLGYQVPLGTDGLRVGVNGSVMSYRVLNSSFQTLGSNGSSTTGGLEASYPLIRSRSTNLMTLLNWNYNSFRNWNFLGSQADNTYDTSVAQFGVSGNILDDFMGGGVSTGSLMASAGTIGKNAWTASGPNVTGVAGNFGKLRYGFTRTQAFNVNGLIGYLSVSGQAASHNMDSSEQLYLGGPLNVRAYASGQGAASQGNLTSIELRQSLPFQTMVAAFYDIGNVQTLKFNTPNINYNSYVLQGYGLSLLWYGPYGFNVKGVWAHRSGNLSPGVANYLSQNGGLSQNRFWINASLPF